MGVMGRRRGVDGRRRRRSSSDRSSSGSRSNDNHSNSRSSSSTSRHISMFFSGAGKGHGWASSTVFHQRHVGGRAVFSGDTEPAGARAATEFLSPHPIPSSATASASINDRRLAGLGNRGRLYQLSEACCPVSMSGFNAEGVAVDEREKWCQVSARSG